MIPNFNTEGNLPPGVYKAKWSEIKKRYGFTFHRENLLFGLEEGISVLRKSWCKKIYLDGSFITTKPRPNDFDVCYEPPPDLNKFKIGYPEFFDFSNNRSKQKKKYKGEFWPTTANLDLNYTILEGFQHDKYTGKEKGIIEIDLEND
ncbi:MAG TPA: hypothetical protein VMV77_10385 [Bacteroidales bacterium]|nr:hypothetical protein [Bacteroidales bacterium]